MEEFLREKREELVWALSAQGYTDAQIGRLFNVSRATIFHIIRRKPKSYKSPWRKVK